MTHSRSILLVAAATLLVCCDKDDRPQEVPTISVPTATPSVAPPPPEPEPVPKGPTFEKLAEFSTKYKADKEHESRAANIELLAKKLNKVIVIAPNPGESNEFSFNMTVGPRTKEAGFREAPTYFMGEVMPGMGGGTCQVSSTLYAALLQVNANITERHPHSRPSSYIAPGLDATVNFPKECWGAFDDKGQSTGDPRVCYDLRFKDPYDSPLRIEATTSNKLDDEQKKTLTISIWGWADVPEVTTKWISYGGKPFDTRYRRVNYWHNARKRLKQSGRPGLSGARMLTIKYPDGKTEKKAVYSHYNPVPEVFEVGMEFERPVEESDDQRSSE